MKTHGLSGPSGYIVRWWAVFKTSMAESHDFRAKYCSHWYKLPWDKSHTLWCQWKNSLWLQKEDWIGPLKKCGHKYLMVALLSGDLLITLPGYGSFLCLLCHGLMTEECLYRLICEVAKWCPGKLRDAKVFEMPWFEEGSPTFLMFPSSYKEKQCSLTGRCVKNSSILCPCSFIRIIRFLI